MWAPGDFEEYRARWPRTPDLEHPDPGTTARFVAAWGWGERELDDRLVAAVGDRRLVFVRGFLGNWMPGNLSAPVAALQALGIRAELARTATSRTVDANVERLGRLVGPGDERLLLVGHSKGGLECLLLAQRHPEVGARCDGVVLSQTPRGPSAVLESLLERAHQDSVGPKRWVEEWSQRIGLHAVGAAGGGRQLTAAPLAEVVAEIDGGVRAFDVWQTASWSSQPTTWLDSFHERLEEIRPGCAHDGQFFLEDLIWPDLPHVLLPHLDHAQPVMGGFGFDHVRYWKVVLTLFCEGS